MPGYISEIRYNSDVAADFIELAIPAGTDTSSYTVVVYNAGGSVASTYTLGSVITTINGSDVYVVDDA